MLRDYFSLDINDEGELVSLPLLLKGYTPSMGKLPSFLLRLGPNVRTKPTFFFCPSSKWSLVSNYLASAPTAYRQLQKKGCMFRCMHNGFGTLIHPIPIESSFWAEHHDTQHFFLPLPPNPSTPPWKSQTLTPYPLNPLVYPCLPNPPAPSSPDI